MSIKLFHYHSSSSPLTSSFLSISLLIQDIALKRSKRDDKILIIKIESTQYNDENVLNVLCAFESSLRGWEPSSSDSFSFFINHFSGICSMPMANLIYRTKTEYVNIRLISVKLYAFPKANNSEQRVKRAMKFKQKATKQFKVFKYDVNETTIEILRDSLSNFGSTWISIDIVNLTLSSVTIMMVKHAANLKVMKMYIQQVKCLKMEIKLYFMFREHSSFEQCALLITLFIGFLIEQAKLWDVW